MESAGGELEGTLLVFFQRVLKEVPKETVTYELGPHRDREPATGISGAGGRVLGKRSHQCKDPVAEGSWCAPGEQGGQQAGEEGGGEAKGTLQRPSRAGLSASSSSSSSL